MRFTESKRSYKKAKKYLVGGVNSPVRAFKAVGGNPLFIKKAKGSKIYDVDNNEYIDYVMSWGAIILGHSHPQVIKEIKKTIDLGTSFGAPIEKETELAKIIISAFPSIEKIRLVNSGTEAVMSAIRLARGFTKKNKIIKFEGCYHGHFDSLLVKAGSGILTFGIPQCAGITKGISKDTYVLPFNDIDKVAELIKRKNKEISCVIVEPICGNMGLVSPKENFLFHLRELTKRYNILLIFDEVITGFRLCFGGAQNIYKISPDITCLGKIIGGGFPLAALGGKKEIMKDLAPEGNVYQAGTLAGNPIAVSAGLTTLKILSKMDYNELEKKTEKLCRGISHILKKKNIDFCLNHIGSMFCLFFTKKRVFDLNTAMTSDTKKYAFYFWKMIKNGIYIAPSQFETNFLSFSHLEEDLDFTLRAFKCVF
ncbi:MAG: glutamate-1-semialdehyde 2,1-aminomutase [Candidatus Omnitrophica bacterium]|nr:glutamate-1-semialdehyde 2,1-aminomutase [Candidatus Omnitrophota bacterium]